MSEVPVRVWRMPVNGGFVYVSYPTDNVGYSLFSCLACGKIYAASVANEVYIGPPIASVIASGACTACGAPMASSLRAYPDSYLSREGGIEKFVRPDLIPDAEHSEVVDLESLY